MHVPDFSARLPSYTSHILVHWRWVRRVIAVLIVACAIFLYPSAGNWIFPADVAAPIVAVGLPDYRVEGYRVDCEILIDGGVLITETVDLDYLTDVESVLFKIPLDKATSLDLQKVALSDRTVSDHAGSLVEVLPAVTSDQASRQNLTYTFNTDDDPRRLRIRVSGESGTSHRFVISYKLLGTLVRVGDSVLFRRSFFTTLGAVSITEPILMIHFPGTGSNDAVWFQSLSTASFLSAQVDADTVQLSSTLLKSNEPMEAVLLLPAAQGYPTAVAGPEAIGRTELIDRIELEMQKLNRMEQTRRLLSFLVWILMFAAVFLFVMLVLIFDREGLMRLDRSTEAPIRSAFRPAVLARLFRRHQPGQLLLGTLIDLVQRGKLRLDGHVFSLNEKDPGNYEGMVAYEIFLLQWLFERMANSKTISTAQIRNYALDRRTAPEFAAYYEQLIMLVGDEQIKGGLVDLEKSRRGKRIGIALGITFAVLGILISLLIFSAMGLVLLLPAIGFFAYGQKLRHLTREGHQQANIGRAFRKTLKNYARLTGTPALDPTVVAANLPHAIALGLTRTFLNQIEQGYSQKPDQIGLWLSMFTQSMIADDPVVQLTHFTKDLEAMDSTLSASLYFALGFHFHE